MLGHGREWSPVVTRPTTLACNWDGVCAYSDRACWEFSQKFHAVMKVSFLRLWVSDPVQSPVTKCPHLYLNCRRVGIHQQCLTRAGWRLAQRRRSVSATTPADVKPVVKSKMCFQSWNTDICWDLNFTNNTNLQSLEVVDRGSETQLQVTENLNGIAQCSKG